MRHAAALLTLTLTLAGCAEGFASRQWDEWSQQQKTGGTKPEENNSSGDSKKIAGIDPANPEDTVLPEPSNSPMIFTEEEVRLDESAAALVELERTALAKERLGKKLNSKERAALKRLRSNSSGRRPESVGPSGVEYDCDAARASGDNAVCYQAPGAASSSSSDNKSAEKGYCTSNGGTVRGNKCCGLNGQTGCNPL